MRSGARCSVLFLLEFLPPVVNGFDECVIGFFVENQEACSHVFPCSVRPCISAGVVSSRLHFAHPIGPRSQRGSPFSSTPVASSHDLSCIVFAVSECLWEVCGFEHYTGYDYVPVPYNCFAVALFPDHGPDVLRYPASRISGDCLICGCS